MRKLAPMVAGLLAISAGWSCAETEKEFAGQKLPVDVKVRMQGRIDTGDLLIGSDDRYRTESDLYLRRVRLEIEKKLEKLPVGKELELNVTFDADRFEQDLRGGRRREPGNRVDLRYIYGDWRFFDEASLKVGKHKLPYSRISLTSSARQLLIERPVATEAGKDVFGDYQQTQIQLHGELWQSRMAYYFAGADGTGNLDTLEDVDSNATSIQDRSWGKAIMGRVEMSPLGFIGRGTQEDGTRPDRAPGFIEKRRDDTGMGDETHLTFGLHGGIQDAIRYSTSAVEDASVRTSMMGADVAGRYGFGARGAFTAQAEYISFRRDFNYRGDERPEGYYFQLGYLLPGTILRGRLEPAVRYEAYDHDRIDNEDATGTREDSYTFGLNHYLMKHSLKWSYNFVHTEYDAGVAETSSDRSRNLHQVQLQLYF